MPEVGKYWKLHALCDLLVSFSSHEEVLQGAVERVGMWSRLYMSIRDRNVWRQTIDKIQGR